MTHLALQCQCGKVTGRISQANPRSGNRLVCYCEDCQQFARQLRQADKTLDEFGGTEIFQTFPANVVIDTGLEHIDCLRLTDKGLYRWYSSCCGTPLANTVGAKLPFVGLIHTFLSRESDLDSTLGRILGSVSIEQAISVPKPGLTQDKSKSMLMLRVIRKLLAWKLTGKGNPNPFFLPSGEPISTPKVIEGHN